ncbi:MAG: AMP-binding protein [Bryobacteraceae bacterium]|nr:AMP-binding protein [Bryobacteraceae bacterium]
MIAELGTGFGSNTALAAPGRIALSYNDLAIQVERTARDLKKLAYKKSDVIGVVLPNGPELASAFLSISAGAVFAPLNPAYSLVEFRFFLEDLHASALLAIPGFCPAAEEAARSLSIPLLELKAQVDRAAGTFTLDGELRRPRPVTEAGVDDDNALMLHSSGTTARPKLVGLTHRNLCASARSIASTLKLSPLDRGLNVMPLFHVHGLAGSLLSSISAGASVYCAPGFDSLRLARWLEDSEATWYSAVPTMHQALLSRAKERTGVESRTLRFVRSSSAHLHTTVWQEMEARMKCPVLNAYGMTEAAHQVASNPLPPGERKYGSTGPSAGCETVILNESAEPQPAGVTGEVGIRGSNVARGYLSPKEANDSAFSNGWFRTGDQGVIDSDGYVTLTGRLKEVINCGGEKISPAEIDAVLMQHPSVSQAVAFSVRCKMRGERVCAAVILKGPASELELKNFARERLAPFKVPSRVVVLAEIPKGPTGKMQRIGMAARLGIE